MAIVTLDELKSQLNITADFGSDDDALLTSKIAAAQEHLERLLGFQIETTYTTVPEPLKEAVKQLAAWWYEQREAASMDGRAYPMPLSVHDIVQEYRSWSFADAE